MVAVDGVESGLQTFRLTSGLEPSSLQTCALRTLRGPRPVGSNACLIFVREDILVGSAGDGELWVWNARTGSCYGSLSTHDQDGTPTVLATISPLTDTEADITYSRPIVDNCSTLFSLCYRGCLGCSSRPWRSDRLANYDW